MNELTDAARDVLDERQRQVTTEGWTPDHDDRHCEGELAAAAGCYALHGYLSKEDRYAYWPWNEEWWKPKDFRSNLVRAGALILAEIERLDRTSLSEAIDDYQDARHAFKATQSGTALATVSETAEAGHSAQPPRDARQSRENT